MLRNAGLPEGLVRVIMRLINSGSCRLLWNGETTDVIQPSRGFKEGCTLSLYIFVMCMERLGQWLARRVAKGHLREVQASRHGLGLSYRFLQMIFYCFLKQMLTKLHA